MAKELRITVTAVVPVHDTDAVEQARVVMAMSDAVNAVLVSARQRGGTAASDARVVSVRKQAEMVAEPVAPAAAVWGPPFVQPPLPEGEQTFTRAEFEAAQYDATAHRIVPRPAPPAASDGAPDPLDIPEGFRRG